MDLFACPVCFEFLCEPVSTACGHTFCASCLPQCDNRCPVCREPVPRGALHINIMMRDLIRQQAPNEFRLRSVELHGAKLLRAAAEEGNQCELSWLIDSMCQHADWASKLNGADALGRTPLFLATKHGRSEAVQTLLAVGASVNQSNEARVTPLYVAALKGFVDVAAVLIKSNAELNAAKKGGVSPLLIAAHEGHVDLVVLLLESNADPQWKDGEGGTAIFAAASRGHLPVVKALLGRGLPQVPTNHSVTPLHAAAFAGHAEVVEALLAAQAAIDCVDKDGNTPLLVATRQGQHKIADLLLRSGAGNDIVRTQGESCEVQVPLASSCCCWPSSWQRLH